MSSAPDMAPYGRKVGEAYGALLLIGLAGLPETTDEAVDAVYAITMDGVGACARQLGELGFDRSQVRAWADVVTATIHSMLVEARGTVGPTLVQ